MPIPLDKLLGRPAGPRPPAPDTLPHRALEFLRQHPEEAWRATEVAAALDIAQTTLSPALTRLRRKGLVDNRDGHWYAVPDDEVAKRAAMMGTTRHANAKWGAEVPADWPTAPRE